MDSKGKPISNLSTLSLYGNNYPEDQASIKIYPKQWCRGLAAKSVFTVDALEQHFGLLSLMWHWYVKVISLLLPVDCDPLAGQAHGF